MKVTDTFQQNLETILSYIDDATGLSLRDKKEDALRLFQSADAQTLKLSVRAIDKVLSRVDGDGKSFLQVNFDDGNKLLLTDTLIGFKPAAHSGLDMSKLPNVVTTPDLIGVLEAVEESVDLGCTDAEIEVLKKLYYSVIDGAEKVGFDLALEKTWLNHVYQFNAKASA